MASWTRSSEVGGFQASFKHIPGFRLLPRCREMILLFPAHPIVSAATRCSPIELAAASCLTQLSASGGIRVHSRIPRLEDARSAILAGTFFGGQNLWRWI